jgi:hypothetical protein
MGFYGNPKWILLKDGELIIANNVQFHSELHRDKTEIVGGGWWYWDRTLDIFYLYKSSEDFGQCTPEQLNGTYVERNVPRGVKFMYSHYYDLQKAIENAIPVSVKID